LFLEAFKTQTLPPDEVGVQSGEADDAGEAAAGKQTATKTAQTAETTAAGPGRKRFPDISFSFSEVSSTGCKSHAGTDTTKARGKGDTGVSDAVTWWRSRFAVSARAEKNQPYGREAVQAIQVAQRPMLGHGGEAAHLLGSWTAKPALRLLEDALVMRASLRASPVSRSSRRGLEL
jgi:hypothetical protein